MQSVTKEAKAAVEIGNWIGARRITKGVQCKHFMAVLRSNTLCVCFEAIVTRKSPMQDTTN